MNNMENVMATTDTSPAYDFLLNMWILKRVDEEYLDKMVTKGRITADEKKVILLTKQSD